MALMVGGMATIAGGVMAAYIQFGISAGHLLTASVISAPASLMFAKIVIPETEASDTVDSSSRAMPRDTVNGLDAICQGASDGIKISMNVMAMLIAFVAVVAMANYLLSYALARLGYMDPKPMQTLLGWINAPFAWLMGIPWQDCKTIGSILGERIVLNEFIGYLNLSKVQGVQPGSVVIATYALCGFANFASIAIQIGGIGSLVESRRAELAQLGFKSMLAGLSSCYCTACVAGLLVR
jgi:CNT family concentrative nucleoside transporter